MKVGLIEPYQEKSGIGAYTTEFYDALEGNGFETANLGLSGSFLPLMQTTYDLYIALPRRIKRMAERYDVLYIPSHTLLAGIDPLDLDCEVAVNVLDLELYPSKKGSKLQVFNRNKSVSRLKNCDYVFVPSEATRLDLLKYTALDLEKITVIGGGVGEEKQTEPLDVPEKYILYVGDMQDRKNVSSLIKAFSQVEEEIELVLAGRVYDDEDERRMRHLANQLDIRDRVYFKGELDRKELNFLYKNTKGYVHPAYFEGLGRPPLEAAFFDAPVSVVKNTAPAEFLDSAYKSEPTPEGLRKAITALVKNPRKYTIKDKTPILWRSTVSGFKEALGI